MIGDLRLQKQSLLRKIKDLDVLESSENWNNRLREERFMVSGQLKKILLEEERASRLKTKVIWAKQGDANTKLFHCLMNARKAKNVITKLELEDGSFVDKEEDIVREITGFFQSLYKSEVLSFRGLDGIQWQPIPPYLSDWLQRPFEEEEVKERHFCV